SPVEKPTWQPLHSQAGSAGTLPDGNRKRVSESHKPKTVKGDGGGVGGTPLTASSRQTRLNVRRFRIPTAHPDGRRYFMARAVNRPTRPRIPLVALALLSVLTATALGGAEKAPPGP